MEEASLAAGVLIGAAGVSVIWMLCHRLSPLKTILDPFFRPAQKVRIIQKDLSAPQDGYHPEEFINDFVQSCQDERNEDGCIGFHMSRDDWKPLIDAMEYLSNLPQCGDVAKRLLYIFKAARVGKYYFIEMGYEGQDSQCYIISQEFAVDQTRKEKEN